MANVTVTCKICRRRFPTNENRKRKTCSVTCHRTLKIRNGTEHAKKHDKPDDQSEIKLRISMLRQQAPKASGYGRRRSKCECCGQRVELVESVAGSVWLKAHRGLDGLRCDGSRHVVKYREGNEVLLED
jgi:hypothetical protein